MHEWLVEMVQPLLAAIDDALAPMEEAKAKTSTPAKARWPTMASSLPVADEEAGGGKLVEDKWRRGQRGEVDPVAPMAEDEQAVDSELTEQLTPGQSSPEFSVALGVKAWEANQAHRLALAEALEGAD